MLEEVRYRYLAYKGLKYVTQINMIPPMNVAFETHSSLCLKCNMSQCRRGIRKWLGRIEKGKGPKR